MTGLEPLEAIHIRYYATENFLVKSFRVPSPWGF